MGRLICNKIGKGDYYLVGIFVTKMIGTSNFCGSVTREKSFLTSYQRTKCVIHSPAKKIPMCVGHFGIFETNKFPLIYTKSQNERSRIYLKLPRAKAQVLMALSCETVGEAIGSTVLAADIGGTNARFQVLFIKAFRITRTHIFIYNVDMEPSF